LSLLVASPGCGDPLRPHSCPTRRSSDLCRIGPPDRLSRWHPRAPPPPADALRTDLTLRCPAPRRSIRRAWGGRTGIRSPAASPRSEEHTSELQSRFDLVCRLLLEKKKRI